ncbi:MAG: FkbM family methyltransferase [Patescibacteria group bacterium]|nr:FkbM family methyltransferase [Patescibacteria group bacterium]
MSISANNTNPHPRLIEHLVGKKIFSKSPLVVIDVGARGGAGKEWKVFGDQYKVIGFEADPVECERLNQAAPSHERYYPAALWSKKGKRKFYIHGRHAPTSSFYDSDATFLSRFPGWEPWMPHRTVTLNTTDFASFLKENRIRDLDVMKLDVEGAELEVLRGLGAKAWNELVAVSLEAYFTPWGKGMPTFSEVDSFMRKKGFVLYDLPIFRWERRPTSPYMFTDGIFGPTDRGQVVFTQALYVRDAVIELKDPKRRKFWTADKILKLAAVMELFKFEDCAMELLQEAAKAGLLKGHDIDIMLDLLTPDIDGKRVSYKEFVEHIKREGPPRYIQGRRVSQEEYAKYLAEKARKEKEKRA